MNAQMGQMIAIRPKTVPIMTEVSLAVVKLDMSQIQMQKLVL